ncbi:MAG: phosphate ABC transporter substrate-binding protein [Opitutales bacterium]
MQCKSYSFLALVALVALSSSLATGATLVIKGSDTLGAKLVPQMAEAFNSRAEQSGENLAIEIAAEGSATGIASVLDGTADIGMLSRELRLSEIRQARARGLDLENIPVARDALVVIVNEHNPLKSISSSDLAAIFNGDIQNWAALTNWPGRISVYTRNSSSGTYVSFRKLALQTRDYGENILKLAGNEQIAHEVANNPNAIGYVALAYAQKPGIRALAVDEQLPKDTDYPLARPLYFLINRSKESQPLRDKFVDFALSSKGQELAKRIQFLPANPK